MMQADPAQASPPTRRGQSIAGGALAAVLLLFGLWTLHGFLPALVWAAIFAIATWPLYRWAQRRWPPGKHNLLLPLLFTLAIALLFMLPLALVAVQLGREVHATLAWLTEARRNGLPVPQAVGRLPFGREAVTGWWQQNLADPQQAEAQLHRLQRGEMMTFGRDVGAQLLHRVVLFGFTLLSVFFLFRDGGTLTVQLRRGGLRAFGPRGEHVGQQMVASVHGTVDGLVLVGLGEGILLGIAYFFAGVPHPALFGLLTAALAMIPFGAAAAFTLAALLLFAQGSTAAAIGVFALGVVVTFVADHFIRPALIGGATRLPFLWVLFGILGGVETWGLLGLFVGPALMAALILLWREWTAPRPEEAARVALPDPAQSRSSQARMVPLQSHPTS